MHVKHMRVRAIWNQGGNAESLRPYGMEPPLFLCYKKFRGNSYDTKGSDVPMRIRAKQILRRK